MSDTKITRLESLGMVTIRGDLAQIATALGRAMPEPLQVRDGLAWMSPDELLLFCDDGAAQSAQIAGALAGSHHLVMDMSGARAVFEITGPGAQAILATGSPADLDTLPVNGIRRTRLGTLAAAIWRTGDESWRLLVFASVADYVAEWLDTALRDGGYPKR